jgi:hypothetical protein
MKQLFGLAAIAAFVAFTLPFLSGSAHRPWPHGNEGPADLMVDLLVTLLLMIIPIQF